MTVYSPDEDAAAVAPDAPDAPDALSCAPARASGDPAADSHDAATAEALAKLDSIRQSIDNVDAALIHLLAERFKFTQKVGRLKADYGLPAADLAREARQIKRLRALAEESHLDPEFAEKFLNFIVAEVIHHHERIAADTGAVPIVPLEPLDTID